MLSNSSKAHDLQIERATRIFHILAVSNRLKIVHCLCDGELNVTQLLTEIDATQSNTSQHLKILYRAGIVARRRDGVKIYYRISDELVANLCKAVCMEVHQKSQVSGVKKAA